MTPTHEPSRICTVPDTCFGDEHVTECGYWHATPTDIPTRKMDRDELLAWLAANSPFPAWAWENACPTISELRASVRKIKASATLLDKVRGY